MCCPRRGRSTAASASEAEFQEREKERKKLKPVHLGWTAFGALIATIVLGVLMPIFAGNGDPFFGLAGRVLCTGKCEGCDGPMVTESWTTQTTDGTSTQFDFYCSPPGAARQDRVPVSDGAVMFTVFAMLFPVCLLLALGVLGIIRLGGR